MYRPPIRMPKTWREWLIPIAVFAALGLPLFIAYQQRVEQGRAECRLRCTETGYKSYHYQAPRRGTIETCTCSQRESKQ